MTESIGLGGAGNISSPVISPHDPQIMLVACDVSGVYWTGSGGK